jgi:hypothetical protein
MSDHLDPVQPHTDRSVKVPHLVFGLLFLGFAGLWAMGESGVISGARAAVYAPAVLILAGVVGLVASLASGHARRGGAVALDRPHQTTDDTDTTSEED